MKGFVVVSVSSIGRYPGDLYSKLTLSFLQDHLKNANSFSQTVESEIYRITNKK
jgi:hypothetical protein